MRKVESITFMFKNYESIEVPAQYIGSVYIGDIQNNIERITVNYIQEKVVCKELFIEIFKEFDGEYDGLYNINKFERFMKLFNIVAVDLKYDDGASQYISVSYSGETKNHYQETWISRLGNLYISISPKKSLEDFILEKDANDRALVNLRKGSVLQEPKKIDEDEYEEAFL